MNVIERRIIYFLHRMLLLLITMGGIYGTQVGGGQRAYSGTTLAQSLPTFSGVRDNSRQSRPFVKGRESVTSNVSHSFKLVPSEQWILSQLNAGLEADLKERFPDEADRFVDASFIRLLLAGPYYPDDVWSSRINVKVWRHGIHISNARIVRTLDLSNAEIPYDTSFNDCIFQDDVFLNKATFKGSLNLDRTTFEGIADFTYLVTSRNFSFQKTVFNGPAHFYKINVGDNLTGAGAEFNEIREGVNFEGMKVGGYVFLWHVIFKGPVRFYRAIVNDNLETDEAVFSERSKLTNFENMQINGHAFFRRAIFHGPVSFNSTRVGGSFETGDAQGGARFNGPVDFSNVTAEAVGFPKTYFSGSIALREMKYRRMSSGVPRNLLVMLSQSHYDSGAYSELEQYCQRSGDLELADEVYIQKRRRERSQLSVGSKFGNLMLDWLIGFGRHPGRTLLWSAVIVVGAALLVFRKNHMQAKDPNDESRHYSAFLYSLDLLLPIINLQSASIWRPKPDSRLARRYVPIHVISGWILGSFLAAALAGLLK